MLCFKSTRPLPIFPLLFWSTHSLLSTITSYFYINTVCAIPVEVCKSLPLSFIYGRPNSNGQRNQLYIHYVIRVYQFLCDKQVFKNRQRLICVSRRVWLHWIDLNLNCAYPTSVSCSRLNIQTPTGFLRFPIEIYAGLTTDKFCIFFPS
jgi:hypothetical protein